MVDPVHQPLRVQTILPDRHKCVETITYITTINACPGPHLYYYEVVECGRRILLTEVLIFIAPYTSIQAAMACILAFVSLLGFELMRPHADPTDSWLYRLVSRTMYSPPTGLYL